MQDVSRGTVMESDILEFCASGMLNLASDCAGAKLERE
jgi:hypothetical protein